VPKILLSGKPKVGKTTIIKKVLSSFAKTSCGGFYTEEVKAKGKRIGFKVVSTNGEEGILADINHKSPYRVSKYYVNVADFERVALQAVVNAEQAKDLIIIDEIGKMELFSPKFKQAVEEIFTKSQKKILATIPNCDIPLVKRLKSLPDTEVIEITEENRDIIVSELIGKLQ